MVEIKEGHFYRQRTRHIVGPAVLQATGYYALRRGDGSRFSYASPDGRWSIERPHNLDLVEDLGPGSPAPTGTDGHYNFADDKCCVCGSPDLEIVDWKAGHLCADCLENEPTPDDGKALRLNTGKIDPTNIHPAMLWPLYRVGHVGSKKYAKNNYLKGGKPASEYLASARRHLDMAAAGERVDPDTGADHLAHCAWNCLFLLMAMDYDLLGESDFPPPINFDKLRSKMREDDPAPCNPDIDRSGT